VTLSLTSSQGWYQAGSLPRFTVRATSSQQRPCRFNMGTKFVAVVVTDKDQLIWSSADCATGATSHETVLTSGAPAALRISWNERTASPGCAATGLLVRPGEYQAAAEAGRLHSGTVNVVLAAKGATGP
jgi:hypothetical protein